MREKIGIWAVRIILIIMIIFWMMTIFGFSAENGEQSQSLSDKITIKVVQLIKPDYDSLNAEEQQHFFNNVSFVVRKTGHFGEYGILGLLIGSLLITFEGIKNFTKGKILTIGVTTGICMLYAMTDEFHQGFVDGRSPKVMDVCIDTMGGFTGVVFLTLIWLIVNKMRTEK